MSEGMIEEVFLVVFIGHRGLGCPREDEGLVRVMGKTFPSVEIDRIHAGDTGEVREFERSCLFEARSDAAGFFSKEIAQGGKAFEELSRTDANALADASRDVFG